MNRCYTGQHRFYAGVDLHARTMDTHVLDATGTTVFEQDLPADPAAFFEAVKPFRDGLVVGAECMFSWYWPTCAKTRRSPSCWGTRCT